jgi:hypothetical protein
MQTEERAKDNKRKKIGRICLKENKIEEILFKLEDI